MSWFKNIVRTCHTVLIDIKAFLHRQRWKEALIFFCFVLLSFGFWLLQSLQQEYETDMSIPIRYTNVPDDIIFTNKIPQAINIRIKDKGSALLNYTIGQKFRSITIDMTGLSKESGKFTVDKRYIEAEVQKQVLATTTLYSIEPQAITLRFGMRKSKEFPIVFQGNIQTEKGFLVSSDIQISPSRVTVYASDSILDTIQEIKTVYTEIKNGKKSITRVVALEPIEGTNFETNNVSVTIPIEEYTEKMLSIPVTVTGVPVNYKIRTFPQAVEVACNIPISRFKELTEDMFTVEVPYAQLEENVSGSIDVQVTKKPDWVRYCHVSPAKIEFLLEQNTSFK
ncbi:CdaR family protein [Parabacteroides sp. AD58]|uniref:CdaR family protein n=1 Tax=Parabacteroides absconsus TaxID=2951805 RepID=A0ABZ2INS7_9BACT|nr:CdaR family protein [Parabacteroides sp. AD58]MCM6903559.1 CdaR family protein [Parabacteroides sp. AD58]